MFTVDVHDHRYHPGGKVYTACQGWFLLKNIFLGQTIFLSLVSYHARSKRLKTKETHLSEENF